MKGRAIVRGIIGGVVLCGLLVWSSHIPALPQASSVPTVQVDEEQTVNRLDFPSAADLSAEQLRQEIDTLMADAKAWGMNTVVFQVRPACDALYDSELFPISSAISTSGALPDGLDVLAYAVEAAHGQGLALHAWINPLRVTTGTADAPHHDLSVLPQNSPAREHPEWVVAYADGRMYLDPGHPEVRQLVVDGVREIVDRYAVDGIHFDDYFYPYPTDGVAFDDVQTYAQYGDGLSLEDWRRQNINELVGQVHEVTEQKGIVFGVSPFAVWQNEASDAMGSATTAGIETYSDLYADTRLWVKQEMVDYLCPQIYWSFEQEPAPYDTVFDWWADCVADTAVSLWVGHAFYKQGTDQAGWDDVKQTARQIAYAAQSEAYGGSLIFRYRTLRENTDGARDALLEEWLKNS